MNLNVYQMRVILTDIRFYDYEFHIHEDSDFGYLQATYIEPDIVTGKPERQHTRKWKLSGHMTKSEFVQTAFKCCITSMEHRTREHFRYRNAAVFGPHYDVDTLVELCKARAFDYREVA